MKNKQNNGTLVSSSEDPAESQEMAIARVLIEHGFRPAETIGMVRHVETGRHLGRTLGSVWRAMRILLEAGNTGCPIAPSGRSDEAPLASVHADLSPLLSQSAQKRALIG